MKILAYDTSSDVLTAAIFEGPKQIAELESRSFARHSSTLVPSLERLLNEHHISLSEIDVMAIGLGPGSFTGLRVGITAAKIFGYIRKIKIVGISSLEAIAREAADHEGDIAVILDAKKDKLYACVFRERKGALKAVNKPQLTKIDALLKGVRTQRLFLGDGTKIYRDRILNTKFCSIADNAEMVYPKASNIARQALTLIQQKKFLDPFTLEPLYLHSRDCNVMKK